MRQISARSLAVISLLAFLVQPAFAAVPLLPLPVNTGVDDSGTVKADGTFDSHYIVNTFGNAITDAGLSATPPVDTVSAWVVSPLDLEGAHTISSINSTWPAPAR